MHISVFVEPHERVDAIDAYGKRLTGDQIEEIQFAPESALIHLSFYLDDKGRDFAIVEIIEEG